MQRSTGVVAKGNDAYITPAEGDMIYKEWYVQAVPFRRCNRPQVCV